MLRPLAAALLVALALLAAGCSTGAGTGTTAPPLSQPASPQSADLEWSEVFSEESGEAIFRVHRFSVLDDGWEADVSFTNGTETRFEVGDSATPLGRQFGLMLFPTGELAELERLNAAGDLPRVRRANEFSPALPAALGPGETWRGTIRGRGALAAGRFVRFVFGPFVPVPDAPEGFPQRLLWITDRAYELRP